MLFSFVYFFASLLGNELDWSVSLSVWYTSTMLWSLAFQHCKGILDKDRYSENIFDIFLEVKILHFQL